MRLIGFLSACGVALGSAGLYLKWRDGSHPHADVILGGLTGFLFLAAGVVAHARKPHARVGLLMVLVGVSLFAEDLQFSPTPWVFTIGVLLSHASVAFSAHLVLAFPSGELRTTARRIIAASAYVVAIVWPAIGLPFYHPASHGLHKPENVLLVWDNPAMVGIVNAGMRLGSGVVAVAVVWVMLRRWTRASWPMRYVLAPIFVTGVIGALATALGGILGHETRYAQAGLLAYKIAFCLLPLGFIAGVLRVRVGATRVDSLLVELGLSDDVSPERLRSIISRSLKDPTLRLGLWDEHRMSYLDGDGNGMELPADDESGAVTFIDYEDRPLAVLTHDPALREDRVRLDAVKAGASIVLERQRLAGAMLAEVRRSRVRIVEATDAERRRFGQDLHDGVQQTLVIAATHLRTAIDRLGADPRTPALAALTSCEQALGKVREELSEIAHGLHPPALTYFGVSAAVEALARDMPIAVTVAGEDVPRLEPIVEYTVYMVVKEAFANTLKHARATEARVRMRHSGDALLLEVADDGVGGASLSARRGLLGLQDRIQAIGGAMTVTSPAGRGTLLTVALPCKPLVPKEGEQAWPVSAS
ncbi:sensor histidine kinase [Allorhizocola rhizosphaerae]|uniref:sensor histidine kinase n=1 Tax=Allorhizocola rhizosphaerae TaxID=1872709 RepID=UPI000E3C9722|nr:histidine kinase [Allorhizocola rhizosphaerae]